MHVVSQVLEAAARGAAAADTLAMVSGLTDAAPLLIGKSDAVLSALQPFGAADGPPTASSVVAAVQQDPSVLRSELAQLA